MKTIVFFIIDIIGNYPSQVVDGATSDRH